MIQEKNNKYGYKLWIKVGDLFNSIAQPFLLELPLIVILIKLLGIEALLHSFVEANANSGGTIFYSYILELLNKISLLFLFAYIAALIVTLIKSKQVKWCTKLFFYFIILLLYVIQHFLAANFGIVNFSPTCFVLLAETTNNESREFINQYILSDAILPTLIKAIFYICVITIAEFSWNYFWKNIKATTLKTKCVCFKNVLRFSLSLIIVSVLLYGIFSTNVYFRMFKAKSPDDIAFIHRPTDPLSSIYSSIVMLHKMNENMVQGVEANKTISEHSIVCNMNDSVNIVVVIGESYTKWHSSLYGYSLNTSPYLLSEAVAGRLFIFDDAVSSSNYTSIVMKNILCCNNSSDDEQWYEYPNFMTIFKKAGYDVYFWDNQRDCDKTASYSFTLNSFLYNNDIVDMSYTMTNDASYKFDEDIVKSFNEKVKFTNEKNLVLFHLMGQHSGYFARFPQSATIFTVDSVKRDNSFLNDEMKQCIADYDNATLYNDYVLSMILDTFKNSNTILFYFSDHGEEVYDYRAKCGRDHAGLNDQLLKYQYDIPFVIWCSDIYKEKNPEIVDAIRKSVKHPFIIDNICNTLFNVGAINSAYYRDSLDIISPNYKCAKRKIKKNGKTFVYEDVRIK